VKPNQAGHHPVPALDRANEFRTFFYSLIKIDLCSYDGPDSVGGPLAWLRRMPPLWRERGYDVRIRLFSWQEPTEGAGFQALREEGFDVVATRFRDTFTNVRWLLEQARGAPPDVFVANHVVPAWHAAGFLRRAGVPTVGILRSDDRFYHDLVHQFVFGRQRLHPSAVVAVSRHLADSVDARRPRETRVRHIPSGTPLPPEVGNGPAVPFRLAFVGRLAREQKRIRETVEALVRATCEIDGVEAILVGDGSERDWVVERLRQPDASRVTWNGPVEPDEIPRRLATCHTIVLLSDYEGTPTALMEGMAAGCAPVTTRMKSGIPELIEHEETGLVVEDRGDSFVTAIRRLRDDSELRARLSANARRRIEESFSLDHCADRWAELFSELAATHHERRTLSIPRHLRLAPPLPGFAHQDPRPPRWSERVKKRLGRIRFHAGKLRRRLTAGPS